MSETVGIHILHVDDEPGLADMVATYLQREDDRFTVTTATSASEGLDRLASEPFDCVVSDYDMTGQNGIEFLEAVRDRYPDLPFVLYTGKGSEEVASDAISAGATDYLQKERGSDQYELLANRIGNAVEQYRTQERVDETERQLQTIATHTNEVIWKFSADWTELQFINSAYETVWGRPTAELRNDPRSFLEGVHPDDRPAVEDAMEQVSAGEPVDLEFRVTADEDVPRWVWVQGEPVFDDSGAVAEVVGFARDITERTAHEQELQRERNRLDALFENAPGPVIAAEVHGGGEEIIITDVNTAFEDVFGYDAEEVVGKDPTDLIVPEEGRGRHEAFRRQAAAGETIVSEVTRVTAHGPRTFLLQVVPYGREQTQADGLYAWLTDISVRQNREQAIENLHTTVQSIMEARTERGLAEVVASALRDVLDMPVNGVHLYDESEGGLVPVAWTDRTEELVGAPPTFAPGDGIAWRVFETGEAQVYDDISTVDDRYNPDTDVRSQITLPLADHGVLVIGSPEPNAFDETDLDLARILATHATIGLDRIAYEQTLQEYRTLVETVGDPMFVLDEEGYITMANEAHLRHLDADEETVVGAHAGEFIADGDFERGTDLLLDLLGDPDRAWATYEITAITPTGGRTPAEINLAPLTDDTGSFTGSVGVVRDITDRKEREQALECQNERLDEFAGIVSHDLRNPLNVAQGRLELAREHHDSEHLAQAAEAVDRSLTLIDDLLALARDGTAVGDIEAISLAETVDRCWQNVSTLDATLVVKTTQTIRADRSRLSQLLENLFRNAVEHGGEDVTVTVGAVDGRNGFYVADDGPGISAAKREQVLNAECSTTDGPTGSGFGLTIVQEIVAAHGWDIRLTDDEAGGARFEITGIDPA